MICLTLSLLLLGSMIDVIFFDIYFHSKTTLIFFISFKLNNHLKKIIMKRTYLLTILIAILSLAVGSAYSQTKSENHSALTSHHKIAKDHANAIVNGKSKTLEEHKKHAKDAEENLEMAKKAHENLKSTIKPEDKEKVRLHNEAIEKNHAEATKHISNLKDELNKPKPDVSKAKSHAKQFNNSIDKAEKEHQALKKKLESPATKKP
jgi:chromosome segregation ATPase